MALRSNCQSQDLHSISEGDENCPAKQKKDSSKRKRFGKLFAPFITCIRPVNHSPVIIESASRKRDEQSSIMSLDPRFGKCSEFVAHRNPDPTPESIPDPTPESNPDPIPEIANSPVSNLYPQLPEFDCDLSEFSTVGKDENCGEIDIQVDENVLKECEALSTAELREWLMNVGVNVGPINSNTRRLYDRKLASIYKQGTIVSSKYSRELELGLKGNIDLSGFPQLEQDLSNHFDLDTVIQLREGRQKMSFCYILLDPNITKDLPMRVANLNDAEKFRAFVDAIFYIGKGKKSRQYQHLKDAIEIKSNNENVATSSKISRILNLWNNELGVVSVHVFHNILPVDAYSREACMINTIGLQNLTNEKKGDFYGLSKSWNNVMKNKFGVYLLYKAMCIFLAEGERQLKPQDIID